ncbi:unnamed protein product [Diabrotica balteata]|uniref:Uncharacterized protein n=1 Tax=Diabrotica balteata TaxID=107213 RepID=A0A9N9SQY4_DIABA|nr:unnamed protein product [Diabrotica balteata]
MSRAINKIKQAEPPGSDNRGHGIPTNKISEERMNCVRKHIQNFPSYQSHYTRNKNPNRRYLSSDLNVTLLYRLYSVYCQEQVIVPVSSDIYRRTFNNEYNLHFHVSQKDTCSKCDAYKLKKAAATDANEIKQIEVEHELHLRKAELARTSMKKDTEKAQTDDSYYAFTFDLEKALPFPKLTTSIAYYKCNMYIYNLGCHELSTGLGYMYGWDKTTASRGSQEISACVTKPIELRRDSVKISLLCFEDLLFFRDQFTDRESNCNSEETSGIETVLINANLGDEDINVTQKNEFEESFISDVESAELRTPQLKRLNKRLSDYERNIYLSSSRQKLEPAEESLRELFKAILKLSQSSSEDSLTIW